ncbi:MAG TPA: nuclear transport factor 2 family protein [Propioniciclava sp.]|jgi:ketosteroid isomerase-like protein|uniref:nuclear transport factor 2 family protein n=1 Tax=Propioniciclava sp. TaxID=2038686 RepID=UPI002BD61FFE|nr:nuclear transport factor 2 family protein [Propioniciclava sp.]HRL49688.1 nuclear transport factor 2 family protein [Propioniciclava sp.]HRL80987.1 nuclear transport factor 2 family protein [Propioniciclava sp.]
MTTPTVPENIARFLAAVNGHDEQAFLDAFTPEGVVDDWGRLFTGRQAIKAWSDVEFLGARGVLTVEEVEVDDAGVTVIGDWRSQHANGRSRFTFLPDGDAIAMMTIRHA